MKIGGNRLLIVTNEKLQPPVQELVSYTIHQGNYEEELTISMFDTNDVNRHCAIANVHRDSAEEVDSISRPCLGNA